MKKSTKRPSKVAAVFLDRNQYDRLVKLAARWGVGPSEALRRVLDQAFVGRGALVAIEAGFIALEHFTREKPKKDEEKKEGEKKL